VALYKFLLYVNCNFKNNYLVSENDYFSSGGDHLPAAAAGLFVAPPANLGLSASPASRVKTAHRARQRVLQSTTECECEESEN